MHNSSSGQIVKPKDGLSQPSEASLKRKRGMSQKDSEIDIRQPLSKVPKVLTMHNSSSGQTIKPKSGLSQPLETSLKRKRGMFQKDLQHMMYGFGDDPNPLPETVELIEDIVIEYVTDLVHKAQNVAPNRGKLLTEDFLYVIRKDPAKLHRCTELLSMNEELKQARKAFEVDEEKLASND